MDYTPSDHESYHDEPEIILYAQRTYRYKTNESKLMIHAYTYTNRTHLVEIMIAKKCFVSFYILG